METTLYTAHDFHFSLVNGPLGDLLGENDSYYN